MNEKNLVSLADRTTEEKREIGKKGGIASGKARRERKKFKEDLLLALETIKNDAYKRIIRKDNFIGFNVLFENGQRGGVIIPKEQYDYINEKGLDLISMLNKEVPEERKVKEYSLMEAEELSKMLEKSADKILKGEVNE